MDHSLKHRFLFIAAQNHAITGGSELLWARVATALAAQGHAVTASLPPDGEFPDGASSGVRFAVRRKTTATLTRRLLAKVNRCSTHAHPGSMRRTMIEAKPDLIIINQPGFIEGVEAAEMALELGIPYLMLVHNIHRSLWLHPDYAKRVASIYSRSQRIDLLSDNAERDLSDILNRDFDQVARFRNPYNVDYESAPVFPPTDSGIRIAMVGRLDPGQKGHDLALRVFADPAWRAQPITLNVYGDGDYASFLKEMTVRFGLADKVNFHGHVSDVTSIWRDNHALLIPSRYEGLPIAMVEAMLSARPVIASAVGGISEWIDDGQNGFLIPAPTIELVAATLEAAWTHRDNWQRLGDHARASALSLTNADPVAEYAAGLCALAQSK